MRVLRDVRIVRLREGREARVNRSERPGAQFLFVASVDQQPIDCGREQVLGGLRNGRKRSDNGWREPWVMLQMIHNKLGHHSGGDRTVEGSTVAEGMPGAPILERGPIGAGGVRGLAFAGERLDGLGGLYK